MFLVSEIETYVESHCRKKLYEFLRERESYEIMIGI